MESYDCVVVGGGPAGLSAAIYVARYNRSVIVLDSARGRWKSHEINENYLGFPNGVPSKRLRELGRRQAQRFGAVFRVAKVNSVRQAEGGFVARAGKREVFGRSLVLATGVRDILPDIGDTAEYWGRSLFWCITCDGHKVIGKRVAVVGKDDSAAVTALQFESFTPHLVFITNCPADASTISDEVRGRLARHGIPVYEGPISHVEGSEGMMTAAVMEDGRRIEIDYMFSHQGAVPRTELAASLGVELEANGYIKVDEEQRTCVPFVYAAGDVTRQFAHQVAAAVHEGATAGCTANYDLYAPDQKEP